MPGTGISQTTDLSAAKRPSREFERVVLRARAAIMWERLVPQAVPVAAVGGLFLSASWLGLWGALPPQGRIAGVALFAAAALAAPLLGRTKFPYASKRDAIARIDAIANDPQRPAQTLSGKIGYGDETTRGLWEMHQQRLREKWAGRLRAGKPQPVVRGLYPALAIAVMTAASAFLAGPQMDARLNAAFDWAVPPPVIPPANVKAWVTPPDYTHQAPVYLTLPGQQQQVATQDNKLSIPEGSVLTLLSLDGATTLTRDGGEIPAPKLIHSRKQDTARYEIKLTGNDNCITVKNGPTWCFSVVPDNAPTVTLDVVRPGRKSDEPLELSCTATDDYGIELGDAEIEVIEKGPEGAKPLPNAKIPEAPLFGGPTGPCPGQ
jgi:hypothetical protein